jgi:hypothetical protein
MVGASECQVKKKEGVRRQPKKLTGKKVATRKVLEKERKPNVKSHEVKRHA